MCTCARWARRRGTPLLAYRCSIATCLLSVFIFTITATSVRSQDQSCTNLNTTKNVTFLGFTPPCHSQTGLNVSSRVEAKRILESCDVLSSVAVELAVERLNESPDVLEDATLHVLQLISYYEYDKGAELQSVINTSVRADREYFGVIGSSSTSSAKFWTPIFDRLDLLTISYTVTSTGPDITPSFYRTLPSSRSANTGRLALMARNKWFRIASISSKGTYYAEEAEDFIQRFSEPVRDHSIELALSTSFKFSSLPYLAPALSDIYRRGINIIVGFFGPYDARKVLCMANSTGLVSRDHVWILPSYYNPNWWRYFVFSNCSNNQMRVILESVIFIDTVKFPSVGEPLDEFHKELLIKALKLFPSLTEEDLKPYLLRSRATSAYDAVTLLARSVGVAFSQAGEDNCVNTSMIQVALEKGFMQCEYCRLYSGCLLNATITNQCVDHCNPDFTPKLTAKGLAEPRIRTDYLLNSFGQVSYSQFIDGIECPVGLLWTSNGGNSSLISSERIYTLDELDKAHCAVRLNLSKELFMREGCPMSFQWRGSSEPPSSHSPVTRSPGSVGEIIFIGLLTGVGLVIAVGLIVFNIVWRLNKFVKASSPWLNVILLSGIIIRLPSSLLSWLIVSSQYEHVIDHRICHFKMWLYFLGEVIFLATLIVKNWRIYCIFNNKSLKMIGDKLSDDYLKLVILLLALPTIITLVVSNFFPVHLETITVQKEDFQYIEISFCDSDTIMYFIAVLLPYEAFLLVILFVLTFLTLRNTIAGSTFHREGTLSYVATTIVLMLIPVFTVLLAIASTEGAFMEGVVHIVFVWVEFTVGVLLPMLLMLVLFLPNIYQVLIKDCFERRFGVKKKEMESLASQDLSSRYHSLRQESASLKLRLSEANQLINKLLEEKHAKQNPTTPLQLTTDSTQSESEIKDREATVCTASICVTTTELSARHDVENHEECSHQQNIQLTSLSLDVLPEMALIATTSGSSTLKSAGNSLEQCSETDKMGLCTTASDSSNYNPSDLQGSVVCGPRDSDHSEEPEVDDLRLHEVVDNNCDSHEVK